MVYIVTMAYWFKWRLTSPKVIRWTFLWFNGDRIAHSDQLRWFLWQHRFYILYLDFLIIFFFLPHRKSNQTINGIHWIFNALDTRFGGYDRDAFADKKILSSWAFERNEIEYLKEKKKSFYFVSFGLPLNCRVMRDSVHDFHVQPCHWISWLDGRLREHNHKFIWLEV